MDNKTACKVECPKIGEESTAPYPMSHRIINEYGPNHSEYYKGCKAHTSRNRTAHDGWRDNSKHALEGNKCHFWNIRTFQDAILCAHKTNFIEATNNAMYIVTKDQCVAYEHKFYRNHTYQKEALHDSAKYVFTPCHTSIK